MGVGSEPKPANLRLEATKTEPVDGELDSGWDDEPGKAAAEAKPAAPIKPAAPTKPAVPNKPLSLSAQSTPSPSKETSALRAQPNQADKKASSPSSASSVTKPPALAKPRLPPRPSATGLSPLRPLTAATERKAEASASLGPTSAAEEKLGRLPNTATTEGPAAAPSAAEETPLRDTIANDQPAEFPEGAALVAAEAPWVTAALAEALPASIPLPSSQPVGLSEPPSTHPRAREDALAPATIGDAGTLRPSELEQAPASTTVALPRKRARWVLPIAAALGILALAAVGLRERSRFLQAATEVDVAAARPPLQKAAPARVLPEPVAIERAPVAPTPPAAVPGDSSAMANKPAEPQLSDAFATALTTTATSVRVTVKITPEGAAIFDQGKRIGNGSVQVNVEPGSKLTLSAILNGHQPKRFSIDGSQTSVIIALQPKEPESASGGHAVTPGAPAAPSPAAPAKPRGVPAEPFDPTRDVAPL